MFSGKNRWENFQKKTKKKTEKKRKKESLLRGGVAWCQGFLAKYYPNGWRFWQKHEVRDLYTTERLAEEAS